MAQAHRSRHSADTPVPGSELILRGTYNIDLKVTVEWERHMTLNQLAEFLLPFLYHERDVAEIRHHISGQLKATDEKLPSGRISKYRLSQQSTIKAIETLSAAGLLRQTGQTKWKAA